MAIPLCDIICQRRHLQRILLFHVTSTALRMQPDLLTSDHELPHAGASHGHVVIQAKLADRSRTTTHQKDHPAAASYAAIAGIVVKASIATRLDKRSLFKLLRRDAMLTKIV